MTPEQEARSRVDLSRGARAQVILEDDLFKEAIQALKDTALRELIAVPMVGIYPGQSEKLRVTAQIKLKVVEEFVNVFAKALDTGKMARWDLEARR